MIVEKNPSALCLRKEIRGKVKGDKPESILKDYLTKPLQRTVQAPIYHPVLLVSLFLLHIHYLVVINYLQ